jgi:hypothetical protein
MQSANSERTASGVWAMCVIVPLVCVAMCGSITPFIVATILLIGTTAQALKTAPFSRTSTLDGVSFSAVRAQSRFKHLLVTLVIFSVCTLLLLTLGSRFGGGISRLFHGSFYVNTKNPQ